MAKHIIITKLFEFGGTNTHLEILIRYFGKENIILVLEDKEQLQYLKNISNSKGIMVKVKPSLHTNANLNYRFTTNVKELFQIINSILYIQTLSIVYGFADVTINSAYPEKYLYLLWLPFSRVVYILHSMPLKKYTSFTSFTCNIKLNQRKRIVTVSNSNRELLCKNWDIANKKQVFVTVIHNCIAESKAGIEIANPKKPDPQFIITMGHVIAPKNPALWLDVAKQVTSVRKNVHFIWLGSGPLLEKYKAEASLAERITFPGIVTDPDVYLKKAIIYYHPSLHETHGIAVVEAMYNHLPCVVSNVGGLPESVQHQYNGLLTDPANKQEQVDALISLIDNSVLRNEYGLNGYKRYTELFAYDHFKTKMDAIYAN